MAKKNKSRANRSKKTNKPHHQGQRATTKNQKEKTRGKWKLRLGVVAVLVVAFLGLSWYNSPTNYVFRMNMWDLVNDEARYDRPREYLHMVAEGKTDELHNRITTIIENNGLSTDLTLNTLFKDHPQITDFAVREIDSFRDIDGESKPVTVVSITFYEKSRYIYRVLEFSMYNPFFLPIPLHYEMVSAAGVRSHKDEEGELHVNRGINPFAIMADFYNDEFSSEGYLALPEN
ncbi:hypothetical protein MHO82_20145 [Vibrio sp. Of7-15]|uniref:hypothetical protein n=1 Tax=Vibrio sp. Of7-15 TaxID=2724879 RepID=UPI001EF2D2DE|nr:hypothetical protein [Vibrio sp. Of7-15]MCG7499181.1 hypothetical protein [Vibrio sp. Of7-15]